MTIGVIQFPGSNDDRDAVWALGQIGLDARLIWHQETSLDGIEGVLLPGGFSYGDYLRCGAIARFAPIMDAVRTLAAEGKPVLGVCNGFQILCEAGLLPGALTRNQGLKFICRPVHVRVEQGNRSRVAAEAGSVLTIPIKHGEGRYIADEDTLQTMKANGQIVLRYSTPDGQITDDINPNGSLENIAGVCNEVGNVLGLMPHPEHAVDASIGYRTTDGIAVMKQLAAMVDA
ncbi:MAG: phosphoribosylformylglycinamidine synthase subunit PurQ [Actinomycetota bacterium]